MPRGPHFPGWTAAYQALRAPIGAWVAQRLVRSPPVAHTTLPVPPPVQAGEPIPEGKCHRPSRHARVLDEHVVHAAAPPFNTYGDDQTAQFPGPFLWPVNCDLPAQRLHTASELDVRTSMDLPIAVEETAPTYPLTGSAIPLRIGKRNRGTGFEPCSSSGLRLFAQRSRPSGPFER